MPEDSTRDGRRFVEREVRAEDPRLSATANQLLTEELQDAIGQDRVTLPADRAEDAGRVRAAGHRTLVGQLSVNRMLIGITLAMLIVVGVIVALATDNWWAVVAAVAVHAVGTFLVLSLTLQLSSEVEHVAPSTAAKLADEGVADPDRALSDLIEQYGPSDEAHGAAEVVSGGGNSVSASPDEDPRRSAVEQRSAITPAGTPVGPSSDRGAPAILPIIAVAASVIVGLVAAIALGGIAWVAAALLVIAAVAWALLMRQVDDPREEGEGGSGTGRPQGDQRSALRTRLLPIVAVVVPAAVGVVIIVGAIAGYL
ncbi:MAG: hypothetical protein QOK21_2785 [Solirubrobacteraceae bacterium]|jgi:lysylphosphatidylglycerol synthetase-like protein (DUF2156 family)|nr:hypothetical protein [Solirubrobacteraceae bacterium]